MALVFKGITVTDHRPPHVHVDSPSDSVKVEISDGVPKLMSVGKKKRVKSTAAFEKQALELVAENTELCREAWRKYHGEL